jgi:hypothetical protein
MVHFVHMDMKTCTVCHHEKPLTDEFFYRDSPSIRTKDGFKGRCKECAKSKTREWEATYTASHGECHNTAQARKNPQQLESYAQRKSKRIEELITWVDEVKAKAPCLDCGGIFDPVCMDYDHVRGEKKFSVCQMVRMAYSREAIMDEIAKCDLVCANCHRIRTWKSDREMPWYDKIRKYDRSNW